MWRPRRSSSTSSSSSDGGWAAFDLKHRQKQGLLPPNDNNDPFPPISLSPSPLLLSRPPRPFSSLVPCDSSSSMINNAPGTAQPVTVAQNNNHLQDNVNSFTTAHDHIHKPNTISQSDYPTDDGNKTKSITVNIMGSVTSVPIEPEWEDDDHDVYLTHRKHALQSMRSASQHSRAATNAFLRGDHFSAKQHSLKAQEEWLAAQKLNTEAAKEILSIRNSKHDMWKLDLHGLHAAEATQVLREHLQQIETQVWSHRSLSPKRGQMESRMGRSSSLESFSCLEPEKLDRQQASSRQRPTSLQVITGVGNHSRGQAALPTAVRGFLNENGYRFEEFKPGVITVRPKYRYK